MCLQRRSPQASKAAQIHRNIVNHYEHLIQQRQATSVLGSGGGKHYLHAVHNHLHAVWGLKTSIVNENQNHDDVCAWR